MSKQSEFSAAVVYFLDSLPKYVMVSEGEKLSFQTGMILQNDSSVAFSTFLILGSQTNLGR